MENNMNPIEDLNKTWELSQGELGLILGERGSGKTALLVNMGIKNMLDGLKILHVSLGDLPERIESYYELKIKETMDLKNIEGLKPHDLDIKKTILSYIDQDLDLEKLESAIKNLGAQFDVMLMDGLETGNMELFQGIKDTSDEYGLKTWITYPLNRYWEKEDELKAIFDVVLKLYSDDKRAYALLIKGKGNHDSEEIILNMDSLTLFIK